MCKNYIKLAPILGLILVAFGMYYSASFTPFMSTELKLHSKTLTDKKFLLGRFDYTQDSSFIKVPTKYASKQVYIKNEVFLKFKQMFTDAEKEGVQLLILSGTRSFKEQKAIWEKKWEHYIVKMDTLSCMKKILSYSSMPSTSRHHWGTDLDLNDLTNDYFNSGKGLKIYTWLKNNASKYGFCQVYDDKSKSQRTGYEMEKWHWSYLPLSSIYLEDYKAQISYTDIEGFKGSYLAKHKSIKMIQNFVCGINKSCLSN
jgi:D-alanyl-D-alanine carboxypeptidase